MEKEMDSPNFGKKITNILNSPAYLLRYVSPIFFIFFFFFI